MKITDTAREMLTGILLSNPGKYLRVYSEGFGWGGPRLGLALDEPKEDEQPVRINSVDILLDAEVKPFIASQVLDYVTSKGGEGFTLSPEKGQGCC